MCGLYKEILNYDLALIKEESKGFINIDMESLVKV
jgi:hypothetical protein